MLKVKGQSPAMLAKAAGLQPLAQALLANPQDPLDKAQAYLKPDSGFDTRRQPLRVQKNCYWTIFLPIRGLLATLHQEAWKNAVLKTQTSKKNKTLHYYQNYLNYKAQLGSISAQQALVLFKGRRDQAFKLQIDLHEEKFSPNRKLSIILN